MSFETDYSQRKVPLVYHNGPTAQTIVFENLIPQLQKPSKTIIILSRL